MKAVVIGQSAAALAAVKTLRAGSSDTEIVLLSCDTCFPYDRGLFPSLIARTVKEKDLFLEGEDFFAGNRIQVIRDKEITRINFNRRRVFLAEKNQVEYDILILADAPQVRLPDLKGIRRVGVFHLARLETVKSLIRHVPFTETAVIVPISTFGIEAALALKGLGKDVIVLSETEKLLAGILSDENSVLLADLLERKGIRVLVNHPLDDILGETEMKAVRFKSGKVLACEMAIFENAAPDLRFLNEGEIVMTERLPVTSAMRTSLANVYAIDAVCAMESPKIIGNYSLERALLERQGEVAGRSALGETVGFDMPGVNQDALLSRIFTAEEIDEVRRAKAACAQPATQ